MANDALFRQLAPRIMRGLMADFALDATSAAAIVGNLGHESGGFRFLQEIKPLIPGSKGGYGWAQWTGPRRRQYEAYCAERSLDPAGFEANYGFLAWELRNTEKGAIPAVRRAGTLAEKVKAFELAFERASDQHKGYPSRERWAALALQVYTPSAAAPDTPQAPVKLPVPPAVPSSKQDAKEVTVIGGIGAAIVAAWQGFIGTGWGPILVCVLTAAAAYWFLVRPIIRRYTALDEIESDFGTKLRLAFKGVKTTLFSWLLGIAGVALPVLSMVSNVDLSAILPDIGGVPASVYQYAILAVIGWVMNMLRQATTTPVGQTDLAVVTAPPIIPGEIVPTAMTLPPPDETRKKKPKKRKRKTRA